ncbi:cysteine hydrolase [Pigmentiphaga aceris]|uniref:Cysteine hydrolase n=1 Tax=Pigmentiphaga aceris TaxID=1940612 RepID=A0A5C0B7W3_9BURK|nr:cysteine hydrolase family protein [Pigmentiphaga aceris]QEI08887.1 cysteine hydrolase [Pigmentiphaga aceris]
MRSALLVIDVQRRLFDEEPRPFEADATIDRINALTERARQAKVPVIFVQHETDSGAMVRGSDGWQLANGLRVAEGDQHVRKTTPDSFLRTALGELLADQATEHVIVCGYASEFCVDTTVRRAAALGYSVTIAADAHTTQDKPHASAAQIRAHHNATLPAITSFGKPIVAVPSGEISLG